MLIDYGGQNIDILWNFYLQSARFKKVLRKCSVWALPLWLMEGWVYLNRFSPMIPRISNCIPFQLKTLSVSNLLQFLVMAKSDETTSNLLKKYLNRCVKSEIVDVMSSTVMSSSISSSFEMFSNWLLVRTILVEDDNRI